MWWSTLLILVAPAVGSFLGVLADRLARGEDVIRAPSCCRACARRLSPRDLIPLASYLLLRGRCRTCGAPIPPQTLYAELLGTGAAVLAVLAGGGPLEVGLSALWLWLLVALSLSDLSWLRLPDPLTLGLFVTALARAPHGLGTALLGAALGAGSFLALRWGYRRLRGREGLGLGDVKLMAGLGAYAGPLDLPLLVLIGAVLALAGALVSGLVSGGLSARRALPFGAALALAGAVIWLMRA